MDADLFIHIERNPRPIAEKENQLGHLVSKRFDPTAANSVKKKKKKGLPDARNAAVPGTEEVESLPNKKRKDTKVAPGLQPSPGPATSSTSVFVDTDPDPKVSKKKVHGDGARKLAEENSRWKESRQLINDEFGSGDATQMTKKRQEEKPSALETSGVSEKSGEEKKKKKFRGSTREPPVILSTAGPDVQIVDQQKVFSEQTFASITGLDPGLCRQLKFREFETMTDVQSKAVPSALEGRDVLIKAPTGSGKTLAFLVPLINRIVAQGKSERSSGTVALVLSPTKELCVQSHQVCMKLTTMHPWLVSSQISGGENPKSEKSRLRKGVHILFATPGRLIYHMDHSNGWKVASNLCCFVMDEVDRLLDLGFEKPIKQIYQKIVEPRGAQTLLASATLTQAVKQMGEFCLKKDHLFVGGQGEESDQWTIPASLNQYCVEVAAKQRLTGLISLLLEKKSKSLVFFSSCAEVDFHYDLFQEIRWPEIKAKDSKPEVKLRDVGNGFIGIDARDEDELDEERESDRPRVFASLKVFKLHGDLKAEERNGFLADFNKASNGVLLASDVVARGMDLPALDWIIQYDPPRQIEEYLHRVGRAARLGRAGNSCLFLQPQELPYSDVLKNKGMKLKSMDGAALSDNLRQHLPTGDPLFKLRDLSSYLNSSIASHVEARPLLHQVARRAFLSWMRGYQTFPRDLKSIFNYKNLHPGHVASAFALNDAPKKVFSSLKREAEMGKGEYKGIKRSKFQKHSVADEFVA